MVSKQYMDEALQILIHNRTFSFDSPEDFHTSVDASLMICANLETAPVECPFRFDSAPPAIDQTANLCPWLRDLEIRLDAFILYEQITKHFPVSLRIREETANAI